MFYCDIGICLTGEMSTFRVDIEGGLTLFQYHSGRPEQYFAQTLLLRLADLQASPSVAMLNSM